MQIFCMHGCRASNCEHMLLYTGYCIHCIQYTIYNISTVHKYSAQYTVYSMQYAVYDIQYTLCDIQYTNTTTLWVIRRLGEGINACLIHDWCMINDSSSMIHDWFTIDAWFMIQPRFIIYSWLIHDWFMINSWLIQWLVHDWFMIGSWLIHD